MKQAFVQSSLPEDEVYFLKPPVGCPRSRPNEYWHLIRSLYGLKRAPKSWFETLCAHLRSMGLQNSKNSPCLFVGHLIEGGAPIDEVEWKFEQLLSDCVSADFMGRVSHF